MSSSRSPWTAEDLRRLADFADRKVSLHLIAVKLRRSVAAVVTKASQLQIPIEDSRPLSLRRKMREVHRTKT